jgi:hypothetical protein
MSRRPESPPDPPPLEHGEQCLCVNCRDNDTHHWSVK